MIYDRNVNRGIGEGGLGLPVEHFAMIPWLGFSGFPPCLVVE